MSLIVGLLLAGVAAIAGAFIMSRVQPPWLRYVLGGVFPLVAALACYAVAVYWISPQNMAEYLRWTGVIALPVLLVATPISIVATYFVARRKRVHRTTHV
jgi:hypothetical protein